MKRSKLIQILLAVTAVAMIQIGCATPEPATNTGVANTATPQPTPDTAAITAEITKIENDWPRVIKEKDGAAVRRIEADDIVIVYPDGSIGNKELDIKDTERGAITYDSWEISELKVNILDNDAAVASFLITVKNGKYTSAEGKAQDISGRYRTVDTFTRRNGQWQVVATAGARLSPEAEKALATPKASPAATASPATKPSPAAKAAPTRRTAPPPPSPAQTP
jgi:hypothetical protein